MSRAAVHLERNGRGGWDRVGVWLGTTTTLQSRFLPGRDMEEYVRSIHEQARPPLVDTPSGERRGTWEDWVDWALDGLSNGHTTMVVGVPPELTVDELYAREVLGLPKGKRHGYALKGVPNVSAVPIDDLGGPAARA